MLKKACVFFASSVAFAAMSANCTYGTYDGSGASVPDASASVFNVFANDANIINADDGTFNIAYGKGSFGANAQITVLPAGTRQLGTFKVPSYTVSINPPSALTGVLVVGFNGSDNHTGDGPLMVTLDDVPLKLGGVQGGGGGGGFTGNGTSIWGVTQAVGTFSLGRLQQTPLRQANATGNRGPCHACAGNNRAIYPGTCYCQGTQDNTCIFDACKLPLTDACDDQPSNLGPPCPGGKDGRCNNGEVCCYRKDAQPSCSPQGDCTGKNGLAALCDPTSCSDGVCCIKDKVAACQKDCSGGVPRCDGNNGACNGANCVSLPCQGNVMQCGGNTSGVCN